MSIRSAVFALAGAWVCLGGMGMCPRATADDDQPPVLTLEAPEQTDDPDSDAPAADAVEADAVAKDSPSEDVAEDVAETDTAGKDEASTATSTAAAPAPAPEPPVAPAPTVAPTAAKTAAKTAPPAAPPAAAPAAPPAAAPAAAKTTVTTTSKKPAAAVATAAPAPKKPVLLPGTGSLVKGIGDDFEDENWKWNYNHPKSSEEQDKRMRSPMGRSINGRWFEGPKRGTPDVVKRIELPAPGLEGSTHGLLIASLHAGIPGRTTYQMQQDDLIYNMQKVTGRGMSVVDNPSVVTRVYMPPFEQWEKRNGPTFGFRAGCYTHAIITGEDHPDKGRFGLEEYWPGMFVCFEPANPKRKTEDSAYLRIRGGRNGGEIRGPKIEQTGWWTLGLSFSPDGMVHYFASPGVDELTMDDHITSQFPYGYRTELLKTFFYNVCTRDDGKTWSTPWVIDDPKVYFVKRQVAATSKAPTKR
jgi:hypothetical protein